MLHRAPAACSAIALLVTPLWLFATNPAVARSHPLLPALLIAALVAGSGVAALTLRAARRPPPARRHPVRAGIGALAVIAPEPASRLSPTCRSWPAWRRRGPPSSS
ncbi:hypothetical protein V6S67_15800 [Arthrobacter sp. Soc17.1.1.1]|uniref:hypothetical protein n=1 Tax=Arthrobacter sp. Soc17.1.1.1 TaxID=3121277 RepID=UPI002FE43D91